MGHGIFIFNSLLRGAGVMTDYGLDNALGKRNKYFLKFPQMIVLGNKFNNC
jgi:hypothetical protein